MLNKEKLIKSLTKAIKIEKSFGGDPDKINWGSEAGILLSVNQAAYFLELLSFDAENAADAEAYWKSIENDLLPVSLEEGAKMIFTAGMKAGLNKY